MTDYFSTAYYSFDGIHKYIGFPLENHLNDGATVILDLMDENEDTSGRLVSVDIGRDYRPATKEEIDEWCGRKNSVINITLAPGAIMPTRGTDGAAGYDLYAIEDVTINCFQFTLVSTGVAMAIPAGHYGRIAPRSGLAVKHGVMVGAVVIDSDYRGEIKVALATLNGVYEFKKGDRIAQIIIEPVVTPELVQVDSLDDSERGDGGFGSTGK